QQLRLILGGPSRDIPATLGYSAGDAIIHRDDLVLLDPRPAQS
ncbi:MAG: glutamate 5-kinase, partial [Myxococcota bacterium]